MGAYSMGPPRDLVESLKGLFQINCFVETGTLMGETTLWASSLFDKVITIEASEHYHELASERFRDRPNIRAISGESGPELYKLLPTLPPAMFFLDAHWSGGETAGAQSECPLMTELSVILPWFRNHIVLIDDARLFLEPPPLPHRLDEWPSLDDIVRVTNGLAYITVHKDVFVVAPSWHRNKIANMLQRLSA